MAPLPDVATVTLLSTLPGGQGCANTFHLERTSTSGAPDPSELADLAADLDTFLTEEYRGILDSASTFDSIKTAQVPDPSIHADAYADYVLPKNVAGTRTAGADHAPTQACLCLSLKTNSGQRSYRGHLLLPSCLDPSQFDGENWDIGNSYYEACESFAADLRDGCGDAPAWTGSVLHHWRLAIYSRTLQLRSEPSLTGCVTVVTNPAVHWLRSRNRGTT